ncbi:hypothetical protein [Nocardia brasiliensis]|uniref:hypothetical protein n=1 Tax=Nocardia brasiliensis TaxID=37326 RepID=UPI003D8AC7CC
MTTVAGFAAELKERYSSLNEHGVHRMIDTREQLGARTARLTSNPVEVKWLHPILVNRNDYQARATVIDTPEPGKQA